MARLLGALTKIAKEKATADAQAAFISFAGKVSAQATDDDVQVIRQTTAGVLLEVAARLWAASETQEYVKAVLSGAPTADAAFAELADAHFAYAQDVLFLTSAQLRDVGTKAFTELIASTLKKWGEAKNAPTTPARAATPAPRAPPSPARPTPKATKLGHARPATGGGRATKAPRVEDDSVSWGPAAEAVRNNARSYNEYRTAGRCFACGEKGHRREECPTAYVSVVSDTACMRLDVKGTRACARLLSQLKRNGKR